MTILDVINRVRAGTVRDETKRKGMGQDRPQDETKTCETQEKTGRVLSARGARNDSEAENNFLNILFPLLRFF